MIRRNENSAVKLFSACVAAALACSCSSAKQNTALSAFHMEAIESGRVSATIDYNDPVLNKRKILLSASVNELTSREIIARLLYLDQVSSAPIDLVLSTPGGNFKDTF